MVEISQKKTLILNILKSKPIILEKSKPKISVNRQHTNLGLKFLSRPGHFPKSTENTVCKFFTNILYETAR